MCGRAAGLQRGDLRARAVGCSVARMTTRAERMAAILRQRFSPETLEIVDDSARHAGHAGAAPGGQTHYSVLLVSAGFGGLDRVARSRAVHAALQAEFQDGLHAIALTLRTPEEHTPEERARGSKIR
jgi:stress-induced morphogen